MDEKQLEILIQDVSNGNLDALENIYVSTSTAVYGFALSMLKNKSDAEDVVHDTYLSVLKGSAQYKNYGKPLAWILRITKNLCLDKLRKNTRYADVEIEDWMLVEEENKNEYKELLGLCFHILTDEERNIVVLHALSGLKFREIANILEKPLATVLSKYHRSLKRLKNEMIERSLYEQ